MIWITNHWRLIASVTVAVAVMAMLWAVHANGYKSGYKSCQAEWNAEKLHQKEALDDARKVIDKVRTAPRSNSRTYSRLRKDEPV